MPLHYDNPGKKRNSPSGSKPSPRKAGEMLKHGTVRGKTLSPKQKRFLRHVEGTGR